MRKLVPSAATMDQMHFITAIHATVIKRFAAPADPSARKESRLRKSAQDDKWSFCLTAGTLCPTNQERQ
jgi:hypothetical protein